MEQLSRLGLRTGWIYEAVVCTYLDGLPHAAPAGVRTDDGATLCLDLFHTSRTLQAIADSGVFVVGFPPDTHLLSTALQTPDELRFLAPAGVNAPRLAGACAHLDVTLAEATADGELTHLRGTVSRVEAAADVRLLNRAEGLLIESLILVTRLDLLGRQPTLERLREHRRVIDKVAPGSSWAQDMARLLRTAEESSSRS